MQQLTQGFIVDDNSNLSVNLDNPFGMNKQPSSEAIAKFRFEANRCRSWDKPFMNLVDNALLETIDPTTLRHMKASLYMGDNISWVISKLKEVQSTFTK